jgi:arginyl-tRNA synthetase
VNRLCEYFEARDELPRMRSDLEVKRSALETAKAAAPPNDKNAAKQLKKQQGNLEELVAKIKSTETALKEVEDDPKLSALAAMHPQIVVDSRRETAKLHANDPENRALWEQFLPECLDALQTMYDRLDIRFDLSLGESFYQPMLAGVVESLEKKKLARESEGAM